MLFASAAFCQTGRVAGHLESGGEALEFATLTLHPAADTGRVVRAVNADSLGNFSFENLPFGTYLLKIRFFGMLPINQRFALDADKKQLFFEKIILTPDEKMLQTVEITAQKRLIQRTENGILLRASDNLAQAGGTATDLLRSTPVVLVDEEGGITVRGKTPLILVNGRNSALSSTDRIPASAVESIEIIIDPSARYDAEAEGGIIQITLKKQSGAGTNGSLAAGGGFGARGRASAAALFNHRQGKWNLGLGYDIRSSNRTRMAEAERINFDLPDAYFLRQNRQDLRLEQTQNLKLNADFQPNTRNSFGLELLGNLDRQDNYESLNSLLENSNGVLQDKNLRQADEFPREKAVEAALDFRRKFQNPKKTLSAGANATFGLERENTDIHTQALDAADAALGDPLLERTRNYQHSNIGNLRLDFVQPIGAKILLETGWKSTFRSTSADYSSARKVGSDYLPDPKASNIFDFDEQIQAAYFIYRGVAGAEDAPRLTYNFGIRAEKTRNRGATASGSTAVKNDYLDFFPSGNISYYLNPTDFFKISYTRRINRPSLGQLNPFIDITDSLNPHGGNPLLQPERVNVLELVFNKEWKGISWSSGVFFRHATDLIQRFIALDTNAVALVVPKNFGSANTYGMEEILSVAPTRFWSCNASFSLFQQSIEGSNVDADAQNSYLSWYAKMVNNLRLWRGAKLQLTGIYNSPVATPQGTRVAVYNVDAGFQQKLFGGKGALGLVATDVFNTQKSGITARSSTFDYFRFFKVDTRAVLLTFTYSFRAPAKEELLENVFSND